MFLARQTPLLVCLVLPFALFSQPIANNDNATVNEGQSATIDLVANDTPVPGIDAATIDLDPSSPLTEEKSVSNGMGDFTVNGAGMLQYSPPDADYNGPATVTYSIKDGTPTTSAPGTVTITITAINDAPTISAIANTSTNFNTATPDIPFTIADVDNAASSLTVTAVSSNTTLIPPAGIVLGGSDGARTITLTPATGQSGTSTITVTVSDGTLSASEDFDIQVQPPPPQPPVISISGNLTTNEDTPSGTVSITVTDADTPAANLTLTPTSANLTLIPAANISLIPGPAGTWTLSITPAPDQNGATQINLIASDGTGNNDTDAVTVTVTAINDPPTISTIADQTIPQNGAAGPINFNITDPDGFGGVTVSAVSSNTTLVPLLGMVLGGSNGARTITVTPANGVSGTATITVTVSDGTLSAQEDFVLTVTPPAPPVISISGSLTTPEDTPSATVTITVADADTPAGNLTLTATSANGTLIPNGNISLVPGAAGTWTLSVTPAANQNGTTQINLVASDGTGNTDADPVPVTVTPVNDAPTISAIADQAIPQNGVAGPINFTIADADGFGGVTVSAASSNTTLVPLSGMVLGGSNGARTLTVTPANGVSGTATITVTVSDGTLSAQQPFVLTVTPPAPPVISISGSLTTAEDTPSPTVTITVSDADTPAGNLTLTATSANGTLIPNGNISLVPGAPGTWTLSFTPAANRNGTTQINLVASDGTGNTDADPVLVTVTPVNDAPTISAIADQTIPQNGMAGPVAFNIADADGFAGLTVSAASSNTTLVPLSGMVLGGSNGSRTITVTPATGTSGTATITVTVSDGTASAPEDFLLTVTAPASPVIAISGPLTTAEDTPSPTVTITVTDADTPAANLTLTATSANGALIPNGSVSLVPGAPGTWVLSVTPAANQNGTTQINLVASDGTGQTDADPVGVTVTPVNDLPTISTITNQSIDENTSTTALDVTISDVETPLASLAMSGSSSNTTLVPVANIVFGGSDGNRTVTVTPANNQFGTATITMVVTDGNGGTRQSSFQLTVLEVNAPPFFATTISNQTIDEDVATGSLSFTIGDPNTPVNTLSVTASSSNNALVDAGGIALGGSGANRSVTITPNINANGNTNITIRVSDGTLFADMTFTLVVNSVNDLPTITSISNQNINENQQTGPLNFTITDLETAASVLTMTSLSSNPALADNAEIIIAPGGSQRSVNVIPKINKSGVVTITLTVTDENGGTAQTAFLLSVAAVDAPPTISAIDDIAINEDTPSANIPFTVADIDVPAEDLTVTGSSSVTSVVATGGISLVEVTPGNWTVKITPVANAFGSSEITLSVFDGTDTSTETFTVTVNSVNDLPTLTPTIPTQSINEDSNTGAINFAISDVETPVASLTVNASSSNTTLVPVPNITITGTGGTRTITVTPVADGSGSADITIHVIDADGGERTRTFTVNVAPVNDTPAISAIAAQNINEDQAGGTGSIAFTVTDKETADLTVTAASSNQLVIPNANLTQGGTGGSRTIVAVPAPNAFGTATITITVTDEGGLFATSIFNVVVASVNDAPTISTPPNQTIAENASTGAIPFTVGDVETAPGSLTVTPGTSNTAVIPLANVVMGGSGTNRTVTVSPLPSQSGTSTITLTVSDGTTPVSTTFDVIVTAVEDPPVISAIADLAINEDAATSAIAFTVNDPDSPNPGVTANSDNQSLVPDANVVIAGSGSSRTVTVTPLANQNGTATITITATDGTNVVTETFVLTVTPVNDPPTITAIADQSTNEDTPTGTIGFTVGDLETPAGSLDVTAVSDNTTLVPNANLELINNGASRTIRITPAPNASGVANITVAVNDGAAAASRTFKVTVSSVNDAPTLTAIADVAIDEDTGTGAIAFTVGDSDTPLGSLTVSASTSNTTLVPQANIVLGGSGTDRTVTLTPAFNQNGTATISITVDDGATTTVRDFLLTVNPVNDAPTISAISNRTINEDASTGNIGFTISDPENPVASLGLAVSTDNPTLFPTIVLGGTGGSRNVSMTPGANQYGSGVITISVTDLDGATTTRSFTVTVTPLNDLPFIQAQEPISVNEGVSVTLDFVLLHVVDPDNDVSQLTLLPTGGANYSLTGPTTITPNPSYNGPLSVPVLVSDGNGVGPVFNVAITVISTNDPPVIQNQLTTITMDEDQTYTIPISAFKVVDPDTDPSLMTLVVLPGTGYAVVNGNQIKPDANFYGALTVVVKVNDGQVDSAPFNATVTVNPINDPPTITAQTTISTNEDADLQITPGQFTISDPEPGSYTITVVPPDPSASYTLVSGTTIRPKQDFNGVMTVPVTASDGQATSAVYNAQVTVVPVNDAPVISGQTAVSTVEDTPTSIRLSLLDATDIDNTYPNGFSLTVLAGTNYTFTVVSPTEVLITPSLDFNGELQVGVQVSDGAALSNTWPFRITVTDDSDAPVINGQNPVTMVEDTQREITIADLITVDSDTPEAERIPSILPGTNYTFNGAILIPNPNVFGTLTVNVRVYDGEAYSNTFPLQVTVTAVDDAASFTAVTPITIFEDAPVQTLTIRDISAGPLESQTMTLTFTSDNTSLIPQIPQQILPPGTTSAVVNFKPVLNQSGIANITVNLTDTPPGLTKTFSITVTAVNDAPTLNPIGNVTLNEDTEGEQPVALSNITPGGGAPETTQSLNVIVSTDNEQMFDVVPQLNGTITGTDGALKFKLKKDAFGTAHVTVRIVDGGASSPAPNVNFFERKFDIVVNPVNDLPVVISEPSDVAEPGKEYRYDFVATDADNDVLTIAIGTLPSWLTVTLGENGHATISGTPPEPGLPAVDVSINVSDPTGASTSGSYKLTINTRPLVSDVTVTMQEDDVIAFGLDDFTSNSKGFYDPDGNALAELMILSLPQNGLLRNSSGTPVAINDKFKPDQISSLVYAPKNNFNGIDTLRWTAADGFGYYPASNKGAKLTIQIGAVNDVPEFTMEMETDTLFYELGSEKPVKLTRQFHCFDVDGDLIKGAEIGFKRLDGFQYRELNDRLAFDNRGNITGEFKNGVLTLSGAASTVEYDSAIRNVFYNYVDAVDLTLDARSVYIQITDGIAQSAQHARIVQLIYTFEDLIIPSAFSPNEGDDVNKTWEISTPKDSDLVVYNDAEIKVYNKNGVLLYHATGLDHPWTGIYNGALLPTDTYYYTIDLHYNKVRYKGSVTLLR